MNRFISPVVALLCLGLGPALHGAQAQTQAQTQEPVAEVMAAASPRSTPSGHTFVAPEGFSLRTRGSGVLLQPPENDTTVHIVELPAKTTSAEQAVLQAWAHVRTDGQAQAPRKLRLATPRPPRNGWQEQVVFDYETSPNEKLNVYAVARRAGTAWVVQLVQASEATAEKRSAAMSQLMGSLRPQGYTRESFAGRQAQPLDAARVQAMKDFVAKGMQLLDIPGVGFSLIDKQQVVWAGGLGLRAKGKPEAVDANTLFIAASNTKAMTTTLLAQAVDAGHLRWDQPVQQAFPQFKLGDAQVTPQVLVKHLVCACTGLPRQDLEWIFEFRQATAQSILDTLATMKPTSKFGEAFQYSNLMVGAAGYVAASKFFPGMELGAAYDKAMATRVFEPLGMRNTTFDFKRALRGNHAQPHGDDINGITQAARMDLNYAIVAARPAGGVWTSAHDMSRYVLMELARGRTPEGKTLVSEAAMGERVVPQILVGEDVSYGMGLFVDKAMGVDVVHHGGDLLGYHSDMIWLPQFGVGATILTNSDSGVLLRGPFLRKLLELLFDGLPEAEPRLTVAAANRKAEAAQARSRLTLPAARADADQLARRYVNAELGAVTVKRRGAELVLDVDEWASPVASRRNEDGSTSFVTTAPGYGGFEFVVAQRAGKRALVVRDSQHEYVFAESPALAAGKKGQIKR